MDYDHAIFYRDLVVRLLPSSKSGGEDLSWEGHVVDLCGAHIQVKWGDGSASKVVSFSLKMNLHTEISSNLNVLQFFFQITNLHSLGEFQVLPHEIGVVRGVDILAVRDALGLGRLGGGRRHCRGSRGGQP
jgi:hypothetical protein